MKNMRIEKLVLVVSALAGAVGCGGVEPEDTPLDARVAQQEVAACSHGMTRDLQPVDPARERCTLDQLPGMVDFVCATDAVVCDFLRSTVDGHATLQCSAGDEPGAFCADVIDRYVEEREHNFFLAYVDDAEGHPERVHWDAALADPEVAAAPISLAEVGYLRPAAGASATLGQRLLTFDPRECGGCGVYDGPNEDLVTDEYLLQEGIWPEFYSVDCRFEYSSYQYTILNSTRCAAERDYRDE
jgi:hypothetical protein